MFERQKQDIKSILDKHRGRNNAISRAELVSRINFDEPGEDRDRKVRDLLSELRSEGFPVASLKSGYFLCEDEIEFDAAISKLSKYLVSTKKGIDGLIKTKNKLFTGQQKLFDVGKSNIANARKVMGW